LRFQSELLAFDDTVVSVRDSCFINGTYEFALFLTATTIPDTTAAESNYFDVTSNATNCSGLFWESLTDASCLDGGALPCVGECFPLGSDSCLANQPTPNPSGSPTTLESASPSQEPSTGDGTEPVDDGGTGTGSGSGSHMNRMPSMMHHLLYAVSASAALWSATYTGVSK
jgi:hypothetical protein